MPQKLGVSILKSPSNSNEYIIKDKDKINIGRFIITDLDEENRRYVTIELTEHGDKLYKKIEDSMENYYDSIFNNITKEKRECVLESLDILTSAVKSTNLLEITEK